MKPGGAGQEREGTARQPRLWVFNLDAELELARNGPYETPRHVARGFEPALPFARRLMAAGDEMLSADGSRSGHVCVGRAWCPTPSALRRLARAGARPEPAPDVEILRRVNHRRFALELGGGAPGARYLRDAAELRATLGDRCVAAWLFKRPYGFAGRGQRRIAGQPSADDARWLDDSLRQGGVAAEPWLELTREVCLHGYVHATGGVVIGRPCTQQTNAFRAWVGTDPLPEGALEATQVHRLFERAEAVAAALIAAGYFGPFGIDAYEFRTAAGTTRLNPLGEINARYSMGYAVGMAHALSFL